MDGTSAECTDRAFTTSREVPPLDADGPLNLNVTAVSVDADWSSVTFLRDRAPFDGEDYDLGAVRAVNSLSRYSYRCCCWFRFLAAISHRPLLSCLRASFPRLDGLGVASQLCAPTDSASPLRICLQKFVKILLNPWNNRGTDDNS